MVLDYITGLTRGYLNKELSSSVGLKGIDISNWQKDINLNQLKESGYEVCYIKITEGRGYVDPCFEENYNKAIATGMKVGVYQ